MENIIQEKEVNLVSELEQLERSLLSISQFCNLNSKSRMYLCRANNRLQNLLLKLSKKPSNSMRQMADVMNFYLTQENLDGMTLHLHKGVDARKERFVQYNHYLSYEKIK